MALLRGCLLSSMVAVMQCSAGSLTAFVNPLIGTRGGGGLGGWGCPQVNPAAMAPFPGLRLGPDTTRLSNGAGSLETWSELNRKAGYFGSDNAVRAFSHTHLQGAGMADYGNIGAMVYRGSNLSAAVSLAPIPILNELFLQRSPWASGFDNSSEVARPGYYAVNLTDAATSVELVAAGTMSGQHAYVCYGPGGGGANSTGGRGNCTFIIDACHNTHNGGCGLDGSTTASIAYDTPSASWMVNVTVNATGDFTKPGGGVLVHLGARIQVGGEAGVNASSTNFGLWSNRSLLPPGPGSAASMNGSLGVYLTFPPPAPGSSLAIHARVGLSWTSTQDAWANMQAEQMSPDGAWMSFQDAAAAVDAAWETLLSSISVTPVAAQATAAHAAGARAEEVSVLENLRTKLAPVHEHTREDRARSRSTVQSFLSTPVGAAWAVSGGLIPFTPADAQSMMMDSGQTAPLVELALQHIDVVLAALESSPAPPSLAAPGVNSDLVVFYTALYHSFCAPSTYSNTASSTYLGFDGQVHALPAPQTAFLSDLSLWDIYRTQVPLMSLLLPRAAGDMVESLLAMAAQSEEGIMPRWPFANVHSDVMVAEHGIEALVTCTLHGACGAAAGRPASTIDKLYAAAAAAIERQETITSPQWRTLGYDPWVPGAYFNSGSVGLEYATNDASAAQLAALAGDSVNAAVLSNRSTWYKAVWNAGPVQTMCPRWANGTFLDLAPADKFVPHPFDTWYTEGDAIQWQWAVPQDVAGLVSLFPEPAADTYAATLHTFLANQTLWFHNGTGAGTAMPNPYYWAGNEPGILAPFQLAWAGANHTWRTQFWSRWLLRAYYTPDADGIPGNDDYGTLSAWAVWAYLGLYPVVGARPYVYVLGSPVWASATLWVPSGWDTPAHSGAAAPRQLLTITSHNASAVNVFVCGAAVNGVPLSAPFVQHAELFPTNTTGSTAATLEFWMGPNPTAWSATGSCSA